MPGPGVPASVREQAADALTATGNFDVLEGLGGADILDGGLFAGSPIIIRAPLCWIGK